VRPYATAPSAVAKSRASARTAAAGTPVRRSVSSGVCGEAICSSSPASRLQPASQRRSASPSSNTTWSRESSSQASESGVTATCSNWRAVSVLRGSTTTTRPPRAVIACSWSRTRGAVSTDPCETIGLAPSMRRKLVRWRSGIGTTSGDPYMSALAAKRLFTSCDPAL
jgi:hypothetical protein